MKNNSMKIALKFLIGFCSIIIFVNKTGNPYGANHPVRVFCVRVLQQRFEAPITYTFHDHPIYHVFKQDYPLVFRTQQEREQHFYAVDAVMSRLRHQGYRPTSYYLYGSNGEIRVYVSNR